MTYVEFKEKILPEFLKSNSFAAKIKYASQYLPRIGSGTGRIVYDIDGQKIFKLAKNSKGVAQNEVEAGAGYYHDTHNIVAIVFESAEDESWLISEKAKKVNEARIKELTGIPSLNDLYYYVRNFNSSNHGRGNIFGQDSQVVEELNENEFAQELTEFIANYSQQPGDYGRPSTYGEVLRDGQPIIVLTDYGLNDEVYSTHYSPDRKNKPQYRMYELYNNNDGNDDILGDMPPQDAIDTRRGMWAQLPYSVDDGNGVINEGFISFILDRDKYPTRVLPSAPYIVDEFHTCFIYWLPDVELLQAEYLFPAAANKRSLLLLPYLAMFEYWLLSSAWQQSNLPVSSGRGWRSGHNQPGTVHQVYAWP